MSEIQLPITIEEIVIPQGRRAADPAAVKRLAESIKQVGLRHPITLCKRGEQYVLVAGLHRIEAFKKLGNDHIPAVITKLSKLEAELWEIDENLCRNDLSPAERAAALGKRKAIYEALYPETKHGTPGVSRQVGDTRERTDAERFTKATAEALGTSERTVQREAQRGETLGEESLAKVAHTSLDKGDELDALAKLTEPQRDELIERAAAGEKVSAKVEVKKQDRAEREKALGEKQAALPQQKFGVILADPEWRFEPWSRASGMDRSADNHYPTSCTEIIAARDVPSIAADDCVLFLWATVPMLPHALLVMAAWGFDYKSHAIWRKDKIGTGYWFRNQHELLLVGTKGKVPAPAMGAQWSSALDAPVIEHSAKPESFIEMIEQYFPTLPKIELNRRGPARPGWSAWGNETEHAAGLMAPTASEPACATPQPSQPPAHAGSLDIPENLRRRAP